MLKRKARERRQVTDTLRAQNDETKSEAAISSLPLHPHFETEKPEKQRCPSYLETLNSNRGTIRLVTVAIQTRGHAASTVWRAVSTDFIRSQSTGEAIGSGTRLTFMTLTAEVSSGRKSRRQPPPRTKWQRSTSSAYLSDCHSSSTPTQP